ncbi:hypothetical protein AJ80_04552 [Polytolypa hystricis UAMH7299]|uniref:Methyltransferase type 11 domain-containing protein n=1 Tax=Polytolypa hystricis (strain UAMH7299) TaxID=1447883 RepID=A0A2B7YA82_POLH7|nr:hypothetical protein AJ80_04552 [Polytolypa hystricis UAMH7299]
MCEDDEHRRNLSADREAIWPQKLVLVDLNPKCLQISASRIGLPGLTECVVADVMHPLPLKLDKTEKFDSISLMYVLHCLPVPPEKKGAAFANLRPYLSDTGTLFGTTVLGNTVRHTRLGALLIWLYNLTGVFSNLDDGKEAFDKALLEEFEYVETSVVGQVLLFKARRPRNVN